MDKDEAARAKEMIAAVPEDVQIEVLLTFGSVFLNHRAGEYWQDVWQFLQVRHKHLLKEPDAEWPRDVVGDLTLLGGMYYWQRERRPEDQR